MNLALAAVLFAFLVIVALGGLIATADMEPCWPDCQETRP